MIQKFLSVLLFLSMLLTISCVEGDEEWVEKFNTSPIEEFSSPTKAPTQKPVVRPRSFPQPTQAPRTYRQPSPPAPRNYQQPHRKAPAQPQAIHTVRRGEFLHKIAKQYFNVGWEEILLANERYLKQQYNKTCSKFNKKYRDNPRRKGLFCNERYNRAYGNTLRSGWKLTIPSGRSPARVERAVQKVKGNRIAIVIDDTGSMQDDIQTVAQFYAAATRKYGKLIVGVFLYANGQVRQYHQGSVRFQRTGDHENTYGALRMAMAVSPDTIILVTDEPGDDWPYGNRITGVAPVIANCLPNRRRYSCAKSLRNLVSNVGGQYIQY